MNISEKDTEAVLFFLKNRDNFVFIDKEKIDIYKDSTRYNDKISLKENVINSLDAHYSMDDILKGPKFEKEIEELSIKDIRNKGMEIERVSNTPRSGDMIVSTEDKVIIYEMKKYKNPVGTKEINKLIRDLNFRNVKFGVMVSTSKIVGKRYSVDVGIYETGAAVKIHNDNEESVCEETKMIIFISDFNEDKNDLLSKVNNYIFMNYDYICKTIDGNNDKKILNIINYVKNIEEEIDYIHISEVENKFEVSEEFDEKKTNYIFVLKLGEENIYKFLEELPIIEKKYKVIESYQITRY